MLFVEAFRKEYDKRCGMWSHLEFFHDSDLCFDEMLSRIRQARRSVRLEYYIFAYDSLTKVLIEELGKARERGCEVQILIDGVGSFYWQETVLSELRKRHIDVRIFMPIRGSLTLRRLFSPIRFQLVRLFRMMNRRNHRKVMLIDGEWAFLGSMNMIQVHSQRIMGSRAWRDTSVLVGGSRVIDLERAFRLNWMGARRRFFRRLFWRKDREYDPARSPFRLNSSRGDRNFLNRDLLLRLRKARKRILIETAYFLPGGVYWKEMIRARQRGVRVDIIVPGPSDVPMVLWAASPILVRLLRAGVGLYEYTPRVLHAKFQIIDDWACVGSFNFNHRSLIHDLEADLALEDADSVDQLATQWEMDRKLCRRLRLEDFTGQPWWIRLRNAIAYRFRFFM